MNISRLPKHTLVFHFGVVFWWYNLKIDQTNESAQFYLFDVCLLTLWARASPKSPCSWYSYHGTATGM